MKSSSYSAVTENLTKSFGSVRAVDGISITVRHSEIFGLIGPDGAGKTTTMRMLAGILTPDSGAAYINGHNSTTEQELIKDEIAYMSQKFGLYQDLTVYENIKLYAELYGEEKSTLPNRINSLLDFSYMRPFRDRRAGKLSGGMKQKLQLICALIHKPKVLLLDEPTNGVDPVSRRDFWRILYNLSAEGVTIIVSTAYLDEAERCTNIALMNEGKIVSAGTPAEVIDNSGIKIISIETDDNKRYIKGITEKAPELAPHLYGDKIRLRADSPEKVQASLAGVIPPSAEIYSDTPDLEDVFMSIQSDNIDNDNLLKLVSDGIEARSGTSVSTDKLTKVFGAFTAVNSIDLDVKYGEIYGFLGPNGAGKSTTIRMLCGLLTPSSGYGEVAGFDISKNPEKIKENIGYMSQKFSLYEDLKVYENIDFYGGIYGLHGTALKKRKQWALELSGLTDRKGEMTSTLSGGWRQRLALACAILHSPSIVFLDEPTSGADPASRRLFWDIIANLADSGVTVFVSTHYMEEAEYCDRLSMIFRGNMIAEGTPVDLKQNYMKEKIISIRIPSPQSYIKNISELGGVNNAALFGSGIHITTDNPDTAKSNIDSYLSGLNADYDAGEVSPSMEDVFVSLIDTAEVSGE